MSDSANATPDRPAVYEIRLEGHLGPHWAGWFGDASVSLLENGDTTLTCPIVDQAQLYALLRKVRDLGAPLVSVTRLQSHHTPLASDARAPIRLLSPLQVELFVRDVDVSRDFYRRVLGFTASASQAGGYTLLANGPVRIALNAVASLPHDHPIAIAAGERPGRGVEFVLRVDDVRKTIAQVKQQGWPISGALQRRPWGLEDFRLLDPDGYYLRLTSRT